MLRHMPEHGEQNDLRAVYAAKSDGELLQLASENEELIDAAKVALAEEMAKRKLVAPAAAAAGYDQLEERPLVVVAKFRDLPDAHLAKGLLDSAGIECYLRSENMIRLDWFVSNALGGIALVVRPEDADAATEMLAQPPEDFTPDTEGEYHQPHCPKCQSLDVSEEGLDKAATFVLMWVTKVPVPIRRERWVCHACGAAWVDNPEAAADIAPA